MTECRNTGVGVSVDVSVDVAVADICGRGVSCGVVVIGVVVVGNVGGGGGGGVFDIYCTVVVVRATIHINDNIAHTTITLIFIHNIVALTIINIDIS